MILGWSFLIVAGCFVFAAVMVWLFPAPELRMPPSPRTLQQKLQQLRLTDAEQNAIRFMLRHAAVAADEKTFPDSADYRLWHDVLFALIEKHKGG